MENLRVKVETALQRALKSENGRHAELLVSDGPLRQSVLALKEGTILAEHNSPPAGSIYLVKGRILITGEGPLEMLTGQISALTHYRHAVEALEDSVFVLTTVTSVPGQESHSTPPN